MLFSVFQHLGDGADTDLDQFLQSWYIFQPLILSDPFRGQSTDTEKIILTVLTETK